MGGYEAQALGSSTDACGHSPTENQTDADEWHAANGRERGMEWHTEDDRRADTSDAEGMGWIEAQEWVRMPKMSQERR